MNRISNSKKVTFGVATVFAISMLASNAAVESTLTADCSCSASDDFFASHVISHQAMSGSDCQANAYEKISWFDWIGGKSPSYQFHFLDLLELLHGDDSYNEQVSKSAGGSL